MEINSEQQDCYQQQRQLILAIRQVRPTLSLRQWSQLSGIQISRLFRIKEGKEMKLSEYLGLKRALSQVQQSTAPQGHSSGLLQHLPVAWKDLLEQLTELPASTQELPFYREFLDQLAQYKSFTGLEKDLCNRSLI